MELRIEYVPISQISPYKNNARKHTDTDVEAIMNSIREFGFNDPIGIWHDEIVEGHGRLLAAEKLGIDTVPIIRLDDLTDEQRRAYALAHNRTAELSEWDSVIRDEELAEISEIDMTAFGFEIISPDDFGDDFFLGNDGEPEFKTMTLTLHENQKAVIDAAIDAVGDVEETFGNTNKNGNALYEIVKEWAEQKKLS